MGDRVTIRGLGDGDRQAVHEILTSQPVIDGTMRVPHASLTQTHERLEPKPGQHHLVAEVQGLVVGFGEMITHPEHPRQAHVGEINMVAVHPTYLHRGVGRALTTALVELGDDWLNLRRLGLIVFTDNQPAIALYESLGFEREGLLRHFGFRRGRYLDALVMGRLRPPVSGSA